MSRAYFRLLSSLIVLAFFVFLQPVDAYAEESVPEESIQEETLAANMWFNPDEPFSIGFEILGDTTNIDDISASLEEANEGSHRYSIILLDDEIKNGVLSNFFLASQFIPHNSSIPDNVAKNGRYTISLYADEGDNHRKITLNNEIYINVSLAPPLNITNVYYSEEKNEYGYYPLEINGNFDNHDNTLSIRTCSTLFGDDYFFSSGIGLHRINSDDSPTRRLSSTDTLWNKEEAVFLITTDIYNWSVSGNTANLTVTEPSIVPITASNNLIEEIPEQTATPPIENSNNLSSITDNPSAISAIQAYISNMTESQKQNPTDVDLLTLFAEEAIAQASSQTVSGGIIIDAPTIQALQVADAKAAVEQTILASGITTHREISTGVKFISNESSSLSITVDPSAASTAVDNFRIDTPGYSLSIPSDINASSASADPLVITVTEVPSALMLKNGTPIRFASTVLPNDIGSFVSAETSKTYKITFSKEINTSVKVSLPPLPGDPAYQAVFNESNTPVGGKYNPFTVQLEVKISGGGTYTVRNNKKDFSDIMTKSLEMQEAISVLASKGVINGTTPTTYSPDAPINRVEIAALLTRTLAKYNANEDGGFTDVSRSEWFFGAAGSAKLHGLMTGVTPTTFAPLVTIPKNQIVIASARVLRTEMKYKDPVDVNGTLGIFNDAGTLADWSRADLALAARENLIVLQTDGLFNPNAQMTRGDAAVVLYRLFMKIW